MISDELREAMARAYADRAYQGGWDGHDAEEKAIVLRDFDAALAALEAAGWELNRKGTREALEPFAKWAAFQLENLLPAKIAADEGTPVLGDIWAREPEVTTGDLRRAALLTAPKENTDV